MEMQARVVIERDYHGIFILFVESICLAWGTWYRHESCQILSLYMATKSCRSQYLDNVLYAINIQKLDAEGYLFYTKSVLEVCQFRTKLSLNFNEGMMKLKDVVPQLLMRTRFSLKCSFPLFKW